MEWFIISGYSAICIAVFAILRIPLNRWTVPTASIGGIVLAFALIQLLNYYHPYSDVSRQYLTFTPITTDDTAPAVDIPLAIEEHRLVAWFHQNSLLRLKHGNAAEVTFAGIPGEVFAGKVLTVMPKQGEDHPWARENTFDPVAAAGQPRIPVVIDITDRRFSRYASQVPGGSQMQTAVYGETLHELAMVRKTLLRMSAWMNYLSPLS